jgi:hypothetical protein
MSYKKPFKKCRSQEVTMSASVMVARMRLCLRIDILFILLMLFSLLSVCVFSSHVIPALAGGELGIYGCGVFRRAGVSLRFTACLVSCAPMGLCMMETCLILRTLA